MNRKEFSEVVDLIVENDSRFNREAYFFLRKALEHTTGKMKKVDPKQEIQHVSGPQLLDGIREYALSQYGPMSRTLFEHWGVRDCKDFGELVFNLVEYRVFGKTDNDRREDFHGGYDFREAFDKPFLPKAKRGNGSANGSSMKPERN